jgi:hypothetical protein
MIKSRIFAAATAALALLLIVLGCSVKEPAIFGLLAVGAGAAMLYFGVDGMVRPGGNDPVA